MRDQVHQAKDHWYKDREGLKESESATSQSRSKRGSLKDYSLKHKVSMEYDMNDDSIRDRIFVLKIDDLSVVLDWEEMSRIGRFV
mgnify:CR=1 FL=1